MIIKKDFQTFGRILANDVDGALVGSNMSVIVDEVVSNGGELALGSIESGDIDAIAAAVKAIVLDVRGISA